MRRSGILDLGQETTIFDTSAVDMFRFRLLDGMGLVAASEMSIWRGGPRSCFVDGLWSDPTVSWTSLALVEMEMG